MDITNDWRENACSVKDRLKYTLTKENTQQDVVIVAGCGSTETKIKAHSLMLFIGSQVLETLLEQAKMNNTGMKEIKLPDVHPEALKIVLQYLYTDDFNVHHENTMDILYVSLKFDLRSLVALCIAKLKDELSAANALMMFEKSAKMNIEELVQTSQQFLLKNAQEVFMQEQFASISHESLCKLLTFDELEMDEILIFKSIIRNRNWRLNKTSSSASNNPAGTENDQNLPEQINLRNSKKDKMLHYLKNISGKKIISGLYVESIGSPDHELGVETIQDITGMHPGILLLAMPTYLDGVDRWQSFTNEIISNWNNGYLVHIVRWSNQVALNTPYYEYKWDDLINDDSHLGREWKKQLDLIVPYLHQLQDAGVVIICDLLPWINSKKCLWGERPGMNGSLKLYHLTHDYMTQTHQLHSLLWTCSFDIDTDTTHLEEFWPGKNYVDVVSAYIWDEEQVEMHLYRKLLKIVEDKPISLERIYTPPSPAVLEMQPRWTWFTTSGYVLNDNYFNTKANVIKSFQSASIIHKENNDLFKALNSNQ